MADLERRQRVPYAHNQRFEFVLGEWAWPPATTGIQQAQLDRIACIATLCNITVVPADYRLLGLAGSGFTLYEDLGGGPVAGVSTMHTELTVTAP